MKKIVGLFLVLAGCSHLGGGSREFTLTRDWAQSASLSDEGGASRFYGAQPVLSERYVIQGGAKDSIIAYDKSSGQVAWSYPIRNGVSSGLLLTDGKIFFGGSDGQFYAMKADTGSVIWTFPVQTEVMGTPSIKNGVVYFLSANNTVYALDAQTGKQKWVYIRTDTTTFSIRGGGQPAIGNDALYIGLSDGFLIALSLKDGGLIWERPLNQNPRFKDVNATPVLSGSNLYISSFDDGLYSIRASDGQVDWKIDEGGSAPVTIVEDRVFYSSSNNKIMCLNKQTGKVLWSIASKDGVGTQPVAYKEYLVVGLSEGALQVRTQRDGALVSSFYPGRGLQAAPQVEAPNKIYFISNDGNLFRLNFELERRLEHYPLIPSIQL